MSDHGHGRGVKMVQSLYRIGYHIIKRQRYAFPTISQLRSCKSPHKYFVYSNPSSPYSMSISSFGSFGSCDS